MGEWPNHVKSFRDRPGVPENSDWGELLIVEASHDWASYRIRFRDGGPSMRGDTAKDCLINFAENLERMAAIARLEAETINDVQLKLAPDLCLTCEGQGSIDMWDWAMPCSDCKGTGQKPK